MQSQKTIEFKSVVRKISSLILAVVMAVSTLCVSSAGAYAEDEDPFAPATPSTFTFTKIAKNYVELYWYMPAYNPAQYYEVAQYNSSTKKYTALAKVKAGGESFEEKTYKVKGLKENTKYTFAVRSYNLDDDGVKHYSSYTDKLDAYTSPTEPSITSVTYTEQGKINVKWNSVSNVSGYAIEYSTSSSFKNDGSTNVLFVGGSSSNSKVISGLAKKTYYVRVASYRKAGEMYFLSDYSRTKSVSVKSGMSVKAMLNSIKTTTTGRAVIKDYTDNGVDIAKYNTTYDRFKAIYDWHSKNNTNYGWTCLNCNMNFNSCVSALFEGSTMEHNSFIYLAAGSVRNADGSTVMHKWPMIYLGGVSYIFDPRLQGYTGNKTGTDYFGLTPSSAKYKMYIFDYKMFSWSGDYFSEYDTRYVHTVPKPKIVDISGVYARPDGFKINWKKVNGASGYQIKYSTTSDFKSSKTVNVDASELTKTITKLGSKKKYYVRIRAYKEYDKVKTYGFWSNTKQVTTRHKNEANPTSLTSLSAKSKGFAAKWGVSKSATGYELAYSTSSSFTKKTTKSVKISGSSSSSKTVTKLTSKKKYYVRVRTYRVVNGKTYYSEWSTANNVKTK